MRYRCCALGMVLLAGVPALAASDPADPGAAVPPVAYRSVFEGYRRHAEASVESWKAVNDNVGRIGGWRVYLQEAHQPDPPAAGPKSTLPAKPAGASGGGAAHGK